jgi:hypothetical protein
LPEITPVETNRVEAVQQILFGNLVKQIWQGKNPHSTVGRFSFLHNRGIYITAGVYLADIERLMNKR